MANGRIAWQGTSRQSQAGNLVDIEFDRALAELQAAASGFASTCIGDSRVRMQYARDIAAMAEEFKQSVRSGAMSGRDAAAAASRMRNEIMDLSRLRSSATAQAYAAARKKTGKTMVELMEVYAQRLFRVEAAALTEAQQAAVFAELLAAAGRPDQQVMGLARMLGRAGRRVWFVSLAIATYEIAEAEDKPREAVRQGVLIGSGVAGTAMTGTAAVAAGVCAATAPVCIGIAALIGGMLFAFGSDLLLDSIYPRPAR